MKNLFNCFNNSSASVATKASSFCANDYFMDTVFAVSIIIMLGLELGLISIIVISILRHINNRMK